MSIKASYVRNKCKNERLYLIIITQKHVNVGMENDGRPFQNSLSYEKQISAVWT